MVIPGNDARAKCSILCYTYWMKKILLRLGILAVFLPLHASAQRVLVVDIGTRFSFMDIMVKIITFLAATAVIVCTAIFIAGAVCWTASGGKESGVQKGRDLMVGAILGLVTVLSSYAILRTVFYFIYFA